GARQATRQRCRCFLRLSRRAKGGRCHGPHAVHHIIDLGREFAGRFRHARLLLLAASARGGLGRDRPGCASKGNREAETPSEDCRGLHGPFALAETAASPPGTPARCTAAAGCAPRALPGRTLPASTAQPTQTDLPII